MQFFTVHNFVITLLLTFFTSFTIATPLAIEKRGGGGGGGGGGSGNQCESDQTAACCTTLAFLGLLPCSVLNFLNCNQANACCPSSGVQNGLINIGNVCVPIAL